MTINPSNPRFVAFLGALIFFGCQVPEEELCRVSDPRAAVVQVGVRDVASAPRMRVTELWRAGGLEDQATITRPVSGHVSRDGVFAVPDAALGTIWLLGADGAWLDPVGRRGRGPGELLFPAAVAWSAARELLVLDVGNARVDLFALGLGTSTTVPIPTDLLTSMAMSGEIGEVGLRGDGAVWLLPPAPASGGAGSVTLSVSVPGAGESHVAWEQEYLSAAFPTFDRLWLPEWPRTHFAVGLNGSVVAPRSDRYELVYLDNSGDAVLHLCVSDVSSFGRGPSEAGEVPEFMLAVIDTLQVPQQPARLSRVIIDAGGRVWVQRTLPSFPPGQDVLFGVPGATWDMLAPDGQFLARVSLPERHRLQDALGDTIWMYDFGPLGELSVVAGVLDPDSLR